jgi:hypothetical protein
LSAEDRYAELEAAGEERRRARMRRQPLILIALVNVLVLGIAATATVDLRRLRTPQGVALRWTQSAVFGDCDDYRTFSVSDQVESRPVAQVCRDLRAATAEARSNNLSIGLVVDRVQRQGGRATVGITLTRAGKKTPLALTLVRRGGRWKVLRDAATCGSVGCA